MTISSATETKKTTRATATASPIPARSACRIFSKKPARVWSVKSVIPATAKVSPTAMPMMRANMVFKSVFMWMYVR